MANETQKILDYTIQKFKEDPLVNTITDGVSDFIDTNKDTIFPLVNIEYDGSTVDEDQIVCKFTITALNQLDVYQKTTDSKLKADTNYLDVINETFSICQKFINQFRVYNTYDIEMLSVTDLNPEKGFLNGLAGHSFEIELTTPNLGTSCQ